MLRRLFKLLLYLIVFTQLGLQFYLRYDKLPPSPSHSPSRSRFITRMFCAKSVLLLRIPRLPSQKCTAKFATAQIVSHTWIVRGSSCACCVGLSLPRKKLRYKLDVKHIFGITQNIVYMGYDVARIYGLSSI